MTQSVKPNAQPIGFHFVPGSMSEDEVLALVRESRARTHTVMHSAGLAAKVYEAAASVIAEEPVIIWRGDYPDQDWRHARYSNMAQYVASLKERMAAVPNGLKLYAQFLNEPIAVDQAKLADLLSRCIAFMDECQRQGIRGSVGGFADAATFQWPLLEARLFDPFLRRASAWTNAGHGVINHHNYCYGSLPHGGGGKDPRDMLDAAKMQEAFWPTAKQMQEFTPGTGFAAQGAPDLDGLIATAAAEYLTSERSIAVRDHVARVEEFTATHDQTPLEYLTTHFRAQGAESNWLQMRYMWPELRCIALGIAPYVALSGEGFHDDTPNTRVEGTSPAVEAKFTGGVKLRGMVDYGPLYRGWWPTKSHAKAIIDQFKWWGRVQPRYIIGGTIFAINDNWPNYDPRRVPGFFEEWDRYVAETSVVPAPPAVTYPALPPSTDGGWHDALVKANGEFNVRRLPVVRADTLLTPPLTIKTGFTVRWHEGVTHTDSDGVWYPIQKGVVTGWVRVPPAAFERVRAVAETVSVTPRVPFVAQTGPGADATINDCGPAALAMLLRWIGIQTLDVEIEIITPDEIAQAMNKSYTAFTSVPQLDSIAASAYGVTLAAHGGDDGLTPAHIFEEVVTHKRPVLVLVDYSKFGPARALPTYVGAHFVIVVAIDLDAGRLPVQYHVHDPLGHAGGVGEDYAVPASDFEISVKTTPGNTVSYQGLTVDPVNLTVPVPPPPPVLSYLADLNQIRAIERQILTLQAQKEALWTQVASKIIIEL